MTKDTPTQPRGRGLYRAARVCSVVTSLVVLFVFMQGLADCTVSSSNLAMWLGLLAAMGLSLWGGYALHTRARTGLAIVALAITAVPGLVAVLFVLMLLVTQPRWN